MKFDFKNYKPLEFINRLEQQKHLVLLYDNDEFRKITQYGFIKKGLAKQVNCIYFTYDDPISIYDDMNENGIDTDHVKDSLLHVIPQPDITSDPEGLLNAYKKIMGKIFTELKSPYFITGRAINNISTQKGIEDELQIENYAHSNFGSFNATCLCTYNVNEIERENHAKWNIQILKNHHYVIYASTPQDSVCFDPDLSS